MGYITNQWLKGKKQRSRGHIPVKVSVASTQTTDKWDREHDVVCEILATDRSGDYQYILLSQKELDKLLIQIIDSATEEVQLQCASNILSEVDDPTLITFLRDLFKIR